MQHACTSILEACISSTLLTVSLNCIAEPETSSNLAGDIRDLVILSFPLTALVIDWYTFHRSNSLQGQVAVFLLYTSAPQLIACSTGVKTYSSWIRVLAHQQGGIRLEAEAAYCRARIMPHTHDAVLSLLLLWIREIPAPAPCYRADASATKTAIR